jgi:hypothetical protein
MTVRGSKSNPKKPKTLVTTIAQKRMVMGRLTDQK